MTRIVVDLPAPLGPRKPVTVPGWQVKLTSSTAVNEPYFRVSPSTLIMGSPCQTILGVAREEPRRRRTFASAPPGPCSAGQRVDSSGDGQLGRPVVRRGGLGEHAVALVPRRHVGEH